MNSVHFTIYITPTGQKRARSRAFNAGGGKFVAQTYKSGEQRQEERKLEALMYEHRPETPLKGPLSLKVVAYMPIPASKPKKWKEAALQGLERPITKPDLSNIVKNIEDIMEGPFFGNDAHIVSFRADKWYSDNPRWEITLNPWPEL